MSDSAEVRATSLDGIRVLELDEHVRARGMLQRWQHPFDAQLALVNSPIRMSQTSVVQRRAPPLLGRHDAEVRAELHEEQKLPSLSIPVEFH
jgi:crotonobetainyl-CoA:carnitine CoA-transferase CaiB-like acyl-CoA transferase